MSFSMRWSTDCWIGYDRVPSNSADIQSRADNAVPAPATARE